MAGQRNDSDQTQAVAKRAAMLVTSAMDLLDANGMVPELTVHLAIVQQGLRELLSKRPTDSGTGS